MARKWSGFLPQNQNIKEEWELLEACEAKARFTDEEVGCEEELDGEEEQGGLGRDGRSPGQARFSKPK